AVWFPGLTTMAQGYCRVAKSLHCAKQYHRQCDVKNSHRPTPPRVVQRPQHQRLAQSTDLMQWLDGWQSVRRARVGFLGLGAARGGFHCRADAIIAHAKSSITWGWWH